MKITQGEIEDRQTVLRVELEDEDIATYLDQGYRRLVQRTSIPGFRKGKAPRRIVENFLGRESLLNEVMDSMLPEVTTKAITEQELDAGGLPSIELLEMDPFTFEATVPLKPVVDLGQYSDIRVDQETVEITAQDVEERLEELRRKMATWEPVERPVQIGDLVTMNAKGVVGEQTILDEKDAVYFLDEDGVRPFPGFAPQLESLSTGEAKEFDLSIPDDFPDNAVSGKEAHFSVTVSEVKERILPELDDEFAKSVGDGDGYKDLAELRERTQSDLTSEAESVADREYRESATTALVDGATFELPELIVEHEMAHLEERQQMFLSSVNIRTDDYLTSIGSTEDEMRSNLRSDAEGRIKRSAALDELARLEDVEVSDDDVEERVQSVLSESNDKEDKPDPEELNDSVRRMLLAEKTVDRLMAIARGETATPAESNGDQAEDDQDGEEEGNEGGADTDDSEA